MKHFYPKFPTGAQISTQRPTLLSDHKVINLIIHRPLDVDAETLPAEFTVKPSNQFIALDNSSS